MESGETDLTLDIIQLTAKFDDYNKKKDIGKEIIERLNSNRELKIKQKEEFRKNDLEKIRSINQQVLARAEKQIEEKELNKKRETKNKLPIRFIPEMVIEIPVKQNPVKSKHLPKVSKAEKKKFSELGNIKHKIHEVRNALLNLDLPKAKDVYIQILASYNKLKEEDKLKVYKDIKKIYEDRKYAEARLKSPNTKIRT